MLGKICLPLAALVLCAAASAGEEHMALRGNTPDNRPGVNRFQPERRAPKPDAALAARAAQHLAANRATLSGGEYVGWRDNRAHTPRLVAGRALDVRTAPGWAPALPKADEPSLLDLFVEELTRK